MAPAIKAALDSFSFKLAMRKLMVNKTTPNTNTTCRTNKNRTIVFRYPLLFFIIFMGTMIVLNFFSILNNINTLLEYYNIQSRTVSLAESGVITDNSGREELWKAGWEMVKEKPIIGWGVGGECYSLAKKLGSFGEASAAFTPHNGLIQLLLNFGIFIGAIIGAIFMFSIFKIKNIQSNKCITF